jgi:hypothetical protein
MGVVYVVMMRMLCLRACLQSEDNRCGGGDVDRPSGMVVDNKSKEDESMHGDVMLVGDEMVDMLVGPVLSSNAMYGLCIDVTCAAY